MEKKKTRRRRSRLEMYYNILRYCNTIKGQHHNRNQITKIAGDKDKDIAKEIISNIIVDPLSFSAATKQGKNNRLISFHHLIKQIVSR